MPDQLTLIICIVAIITLSISVVALLVKRKLIRKRDVLIVYGSALIGGLISMIYLVMNNV